MFAFNLNGHWAGQVPESYSEFRSNGCVVTCGLVRSFLLNACYYLSVIVNLQVVGRALVVGVVAGLGVGALVLSGVLGVGDLLGAGEVLGKGLILPFALECVTWCRVLTVWPTVLRRLLRVPLQVAKPLLCRVCLEVCSVVLVLVRVCARLRVGAARPPLFPLPRPLRLVMAVLSIPVSVLLRPCLKVILRLKDISICCSNGHLLRVVWIHIGLMHKKLLVIGRDSRPFSIILELL